MMLVMIRLNLVAYLFFGLMSCNWFLDPPNPPPPPSLPEVEDAGTSIQEGADAGAQNSQTEDAGVLIPQPEDAGTSNPQPEDAGEPEIPTEDAGTIDPPTEDAGTIDPPTEDAGTIDPPIEDAGTTEPPVQDAGSSAYYDCAGVLAGSAYYDFCGDCVGGTTGQEHCVPDAGPETPDAGESETPTGDAGTTEPPLEDAGMEIPDSGEPDTPAEDAGPLHEPEDAGWVMESYDAGPFDGGQPDAGPQCEEICTTETFLSVYDCICLPLTDCVPGEYVEVEATLFSDRSCDDCILDNDYSSSENATTCTPVSSSCMENEYQVSEPTLIADRICESLTQCQEGQWISNDVPTNGTALDDRECTNISICTEDQYMVADVISDGTSTSDRECEFYTPCSNSQYETLPGTTTEDRVCSDRETVPGWVQAEDFGIGSSYYHDGTPGNDFDMQDDHDVEVEAIDSDFVVHLQSSEWVRYPIYASQSDTYQLTLVGFAQERGRHLHVYIDGIPVALRVVVPTATEGPILIENLSLDAGPHTLKIVGGFHDGIELDAFELALPTCGNPDGDGYCEDCAQDDGNCAQGFCCNNLVGHWAFDEAQGSDINDSSGYDNHGTLTGGTWKDGVSGGALYFDGAADVEIPYNNANPSLHLGTTYTFTAWVKAEVHGGLIFKFRNHSGSNLGFRNVTVNGEDVWRLALRASNTLSCDWGDWEALDYDEFLLACPEDFSDAGPDPDCVQGWQHVAVVVSGSDIQFYIDGAFEYGTTVRSYNPLTNQSSLFFGGTGFQGWLDEVRLYDDVLKPEDIARIYMLTAEEKTQCSDEEDNDNDGLTDFEGDVSCARISDDTEEADLEPPSTPENLQVAAVTPIMVHLSWGESADNEVLAGYHVYRDGRRIDTVMRPVFYDTHVVAGESYGYSITAIDAVANESLFSNEVTTPEPIPDWPSRTPGDMLMVSPDYFHGYDSLRALVEDSPEDTTFVLTPGLYRLTYFMRPKSGQSFIGQPGAVISGAKLLDAQEQTDHLTEEVVGEHTLYAWSGHNISFYFNVPGSCESIAKPGVSWSTATNVGDSPETQGYCLRTHDLFINDEVKKRVMTKEAVTTEDVFYTDYDNNSGNATVYFMENPQGKTVELGVVINAIRGGPSEDCRNAEGGGCTDHVTIKGLVFEKFATVAQRGVINPRYQNHGGDVGSYWVIEQNDFRWNHGLGVRGSWHARMRNNLFYKSGNSGAEIGKYSLMEGNEFSENNYAAYYKGWSAGAFKVVGTYYTNIRGNYATNNDGHGMWTDIDNRHVVYEYNISTNNNGDGIKHEISYDCAIRNNVGFGNHHDPHKSSPWGSFILVQNSANCDVYGNIGEVSNYCEPTDAEWQDCSVRGNGIYVLEQTRLNLDGENYYGEDNTVHRNKVTFKHSYTAMRTCSPPNGTYEFVEDLTRSSGRCGSTNPDNIFDFNVYQTPYIYATHFGSATSWHKFRAMGREPHGDLFVQEDLSEPIYEIPWVSWVSPQNDQAIDCSSNLQLEVTATTGDNDRVAKVVFFVKSTSSEAWVKIGQTSYPPYTVDWHYPVTGEYDLKAIAHTMRGESESSEITVVIGSGCEYPFCGVDNGGCDINATCEMNEGAVLCSCNVGYEDSDQTCTDIDECSLGENGGCTEGAICENASTPGEPPICVFEECIFDVDGNGVVQSLDQSWAAIMRECTAELLASGYDFDFDGDIDWVDYYYGFDENAMTDEDSAVANLRLPYMCQSTYDSRYDFDDDGDVDDDDMILFDDILGFNQCPCEEFFNDDPVACESQL